MAYGLAGDKKAFTCKYICDCIEEGKMLKADLKSNHLINLEGPSSLSKDKEKKVDKKGKGVNRKGEGEGEEDVYLNSKDSKLAIETDRKVTKEKGEKKVRGKKEEDRDMKGGGRVDKGKKKIEEQGVENEVEMQIESKGRKRNREEVDCSGMKQGEGEGGAGGEEKGNTDTDHTITTNILNSETTFSSEKHTRKSVRSSNIGSSQNKGQPTTLAENDTNKLNFHLPVGNSPTEKLPKAGRLKRKSIPVDCSPSFSQPSPKKKGNNQIENKNKKNRIETNTLENEIAENLVALSEKGNKKRPLQIGEKADGKGDAEQKGNRDVESKNKSSKVSSIHGGSMNASPSSSERGNKNEVESENREEAGVEIEDYADSEGENKETECGASQVLRSPSW